MTNFSQEKKIFKEKDELVLGPPPLQWSRDVVSVDKREIFILDFYRGYFEVKKYTYNSRYRQSIVLARLDSMGRHTNPDGEIFEGPHIHIYTEGFDDKFAYPVSKIGLDDKFEIDEGLSTLLKYINVEDIPTIKRSFI